MKNVYYLLIMIGLLATSCSNNEIDEISKLTDKQNISFITLRDKAVTRAANDQSSPYAVFAQIKGASNWYINNLVISESGEYTSNYYWPGSSTEISFYAFAPASGNGVSVTDTTAATPAIDITFTVPTKADIDFTVATPYVTAKTSTGVVPLTFNHMLSKIIVTAQLSESLLNQHYELSSGYTASFTVPNSVGTINVASTTPSLTPATTATSADYQDSLTYYILPQEFTPNTTNWDSETGSDITTNGDCYIALSNITITNDGVTIFPSTTGVIGKLKAYYFETGDIENNTFLAGKQYNLIFTITDMAYDSNDQPVFNGQISFTSEVVDWTTTDDAAVDVDINQPNG